MKKRKMIARAIALSICIVAFFLIIGKRDKVINLKTDRDGNCVSVSIYKGERYLHDFKINSFIKIKTPPQMAIWVEDVEGNYVETLYASKKIVYKKWTKAPGDNEQEGQIERKEALPYWTHKRANKQIVPDAITSATPKSNSVIHTKTSEVETQYKILAEINMSTDFNEYYPKDATDMDDNYSGGAYGSGQPAIIYAATINEENHQAYELLAIGHSSPDGSDGKLYEDLSQLTTAKDIVHKIVFEIEEEIE